MLAVVAASTDNLTVELLVSIEIVGFPAVPEALPTANPAKESAPVVTAIERVNHVLEALLTAIPVVEMPSTAAKSSERSNVKVPEEVIGDPEIVNPAEGWVAATDVTVPVGEVIVVPDRVRPVPSVSS
jgi:hypothetical protein